MRFVLAVQVQDAEPHHRRLKVIVLYCCMFLLLSFLQVTDYRFCFRRKNSEVVNKIKQRLERVEGEASRAKGEKRGFVCRTG